MVGTIAGGKQREANMYPQRKGRQAQKRKKRKECTLLKQREIERVLRGVRVRTLVVQSFCQFSSLLAVGNGQGHGVLMLVVVMVEWNGLGGECWMVDVTTR